MSISAIYVNKKTSFLLILFLITSIAFKCPAQQYASTIFTTGLNVKFDVTEIKKFERAQKLLNDADLLLQEANRKYSELTDVEKRQRLSSGYNGALKKLFESSETTKEANNLAFSVLQQKYQSFWQKMNRVNHYASGMDKARYYENSAIKNLNRS